MLTAPWWWADMDIGVQITGQRFGLLQFEKFPDFAHDRLLACMQDIERRLEDAVHAAEPSRSGLLKLLTGGRVYDHGDRIAAVVGVRADDPNQAKKAAALEYGSRGTPIAIAAHQMRLSHFWAMEVAARQVEVPGYSRTPTLAADNFLRGPLAAIQAGAFSEMQAAIAAAVADAEAL